jgi:dihydrolipoamide dehydrogenase
MSTKNFDVVVIGGGPGGYIGAIRAAQLGFNVACIDEWKNDKGGPAPGGTCTNVGCIPSKALLQSSEHYEHAAHHFADHGIGLKDLSIDVKKMVGRKDAVVKQNNDGILYLFKKNKVTFFHGRGSFVKAVDGGYEIAVNGETLVGKQVIVATGSSARALPGAPFDERPSSATTARCASARCPRSWASSAAASSAWRWARCGAAWAPKSPCSKPCRPSWPRPTSRSPRKR